MNRWLFAMLLVSCAASAQEPGSASAKGGQVSERVEEVLMCGYDVGMRLTTTGWIVVRESDVGVKRVDRMMSMGLALLSTRKSVQLPPDTIPTVSWCGVTAAPVTKLGAYHPER